MAQAISALVSSETSLEKVKNSSPPTMPVSSPIFPGDASSSLRPINGVVMHAQASKVLVISVRA